jgi:hypothetical protein
MGLRGLAVMHPRKSVQSAQIRDSKRSWHPRPRPKTIRRLPPRTNRKDLTQSPPPHTLPENHQTMTTYEYKSLHLPGKFKRKEDLSRFDQVINDSAAKGWELSATTPLANNIWDHGKTSGIILTFKREKQ